jgi:hypothetical protein
MSGNNQTVSVMKDVFAQKLLVVTAKLPAPLAVCLALNIKVL